MIIPLYNAEKYIGECLDSLLMQTFQNFEVIVVDDCSTDNSVAVVNVYAPKFNGRLKLLRTGKNSGGGGTPRNIGLSMASGEYVFFLDADDFIAKNSLQTLYAAAKQFNADVIYTSGYYSYGADKKVELTLDGDSKLAQQKKLADKPSLVVDAPNKILQHLLFGEEMFHMPWAKFVKRAFLIENEIIFPKIISGEDFIWTINVFCHTKRFLRIPIAFYFYREATDSITRKKRSPEQQIAVCVKAFLKGAKALNDLSDKNDLFKQNINYFHEAVNSFLNVCLSRTLQERMQMNPQKLYELLHREFVKEPSDFVMPFLFSVVDSQQRNLLAALQRFNQFAAQAQKRIAELESENKRLKSKE